MRGKINKGGFLKSIFLILIFSIIVILLTSSTSAILTSASTHGFEMSSNNSDFSYLKYLTEYSGQSLSSFEQYDGHHYACGCDFYNAILIKMDLDGNLVWNKTWDFEGYLDYICVNKDGIFIGGVILSPDYSWHNYLVKYHHNGTLSWNKIWHYGGYSVISDMLITSTSIFVTGSYIEINDTSTLFLTKIDLDGNILWEKFIEQSKIYPESIEINSNGIYVGGYQKVQDENSDIFLMKFNFNGGLIWNVTWGGYDDDYFRAMEVTENKIYIAAYFNNFSRYDQSLLLCFDLNGNFLWNSNWSYEPEVEIHRMVNFHIYWPIDIKIYNSNIFIIGYWNYNSNKMDGFIHGYFILKYYLNGNLIWDKCLDPDLLLNIAHINITDKGIEIIGSTQYDHPNFTEITPYILRTTLDGDGFLDLNFMPILLVSGRDDDVNIFYHVEIGESLTINISNSTDLDGDIIGYFYDFGDGTNSSWIENSTITHAYHKALVEIRPDGTSMHHYNLTLKVKDNEGSISEKEIYVYVRRKSPEEDRSKSILPSFEFPILCNAILITIIILIIKKKVRRK